MASVVLKDICKIYPSGVKAVDNFNLDIEDKEFIVFVGPSGCGKSTTLRMIAGLEDISSGELYIDGRLVNDVVPKDRDIAMVFQNYALYPHMTVYDNMAFGLKLRKMPKPEIDARVKEAARILGIEMYLSRKPKALSGGQRASVQPGRQTPRADENGDYQTSQQTGYDLHLRHARSDRGDDHGYENRRHEGRHHAAG